MKKNIQPKKKIDNSVKTILKIMREHGLTQQFLADLLGLKQPTISNWKTKAPSSKLNPIYFEILKKKGYL